jgi:hypothetical protein
VANFIEPQEDEEQVDDINSIEPQAEETQVETTTEVTPEVTQEAEVEEDLPSKYKGKTVAEIIKMHQEAEKLIGKHAQEVGEVRKLADELIKRQLDAPAKVETKATEEDEIDFFADPEKAVSSKIEKHPAIKEAKQQALQMKQMQTYNRLNQEFPDFMQTVQDPEFAEWIKKSPVRMQLYTKADAEFDYDSAAELLNTWGYIKPKAAPKQEVPQEIFKAQKAAVQQATMDVGGASPSTNSTKVYRRADLIRLQIENPDRYVQMQDEIMAAYAEGRVK